MQVTQRQSDAATARRAQIIASAITVISKLGYARASFSQIARQAGISSTRLISYHFDDKSELMAAVVESVLDQAGEFMRPRLRAADSSSALISAYIRSNLAFIGEHPEHIHAVIQIAASAHAGDHDAPASTAEGAVTLLVQALRDGQAKGEFRAFDPLVMAISIRAAIDAAANLVSEKPDLDLDAYAGEIVTLFDHALRQEQS
jgi:AcrR family transcriptional regulator